MSRYKKYWTTQDGSRIVIREMETSHLINAILMLQKKAPDMLEMYQQETTNNLAELDCRGDGASDYTNTEWNRIRRMTHREYLNNRTPYDSLVHEAARREKEYTNSTVTTRH